MRRTKIQFKQKSNLLTKTKISRQNYYINTSLVAILAHSESTPLAPGELIRTIHEQ